MRYGAITAVDAMVLDNIFAQFKGGVVKVLEIGVWKGDTARGMKAACEQWGCTIDYWGIDAAEHADPNPPFDGANYVICNSEFAWKLIPGVFDLVFHDACHCRNHVILDAINYSRLVRPGGFMAFHDSAPHIQHVQRNPWVHPNDLPENRTAVRDAIEAIGWGVNNKWWLWSDKWDANSDIGGMMVLKRI